MITFKILGEKRAIPTCWNDITYEEYLFHAIPRTFSETLSCFTHIPLEKLKNAEIKNIEKISIALAFMTISPKMDERTPVIGRYPVPGNPSVESVGQFEDLRGLIKQYPRKPREEFTYEDYQAESEVYLTACAIYMQKVIDGKYNPDKVEWTKAYLSKQSCVEVISNGAFFFAKALNLSPESMKLSQRIYLLVKRWLQALPGYQRTLDFLQRSFASLAK